MDGGRPSTCAPGAGGSTTAPTQASLTGHFGPFALNFVANLIQASNSFGKSTFIETLEKKLLRGDVFSQVDHIERPGLEELEAEVASSITMSDEEFIAKASYFILSQQLQDKRFVDYEKFIRKIVKDFMGSVVTNFCIKMGLPPRFSSKTALRSDFLTRLRNKKKARKPHGFWAFQRLTDSIHFRSPINIASPKLKKR